MKLQADLHTGVLMGHDNLPQIWLSSEGAADVLTYLKAVQEAGEK